MLALLEDAVRSLGGSYALCDTDSMAIVATRAGQLVPCVGGPHRLRNGDEAVRALTWGQVEDIVRRFSALNPYDRQAVPGSILKIETENYEAGQQVQLWCWALSAKRYALYRRTRHGPKFPKSPSEHGLGHLLNPAKPDDTTSGWVTDAWLWLMSQDGHATSHTPPWLDRPALSRLTVSSTSIWRWFDELNANRAYLEQVKPANFFVSAHPETLLSTGAAPIAPYEPRPEYWNTLTWIDRHTGRPIHCTTEHRRSLSDSGLVAVQTYRDVLVAYLAHPEPKSLDPRGGPVTRHTAGLLRRRPVEAIEPKLHVGKETNRLDERIHGLLDSTTDYRTNYLDPAHNDWTDLTLPVLRTISRAELAQLSGLHRRTLERLLLGHSVPHRRNRARLEAIALRHANSCLYQAGVTPPRDRRQCLHAFLAQSAQPLPRPAHPSEYRRNGT
jgi:hypothetical protein